MRDAAECRRVEDLLERFSDIAVPEPVPPELESAMAHFETCERCGLRNAMVGEILDRLGGTSLETPEDEFSESLVRVMDAIRAEPVGLPAEPEEVGPDDLQRYRERREVAAAIAKRRVPGRGRLAAGFALAASVAILVTAVWSTRSVQEEDRVAALEVQNAETATPVPGSVAIGELVRSEDAWLIAGATDVSLGFGARDGQWRGGELSNDELGSLEGLWGTNPGLG